VDNKKLSIIGTITGGRLRQHINLSPFEQTNIRFKTSEKLLRNVNWEISLLELRNLNWEVSVKE
jgi:hypothetical protein